MVPSILGFLGALAPHCDSVRAVTPTPSRLDHLRVPHGVELLGPERALDRWIKAAPIVHFHGLWQYHTRYGTRMARRRRVPYVMAAHGMADPWALRHKAWKKRIYGQLVEGKNLRHAACLHALSRPEVEHLRAFAPRSPIALIPNGVDLAPFENLPDRAVLEAQHPELRGKFVLLFLSRLHAKKGLDLLAAAFPGAYRKRPDLHVLLAGRDEGAGRPFLDAMERNGLGHAVTTLGHVQGESARAAWGAADAFILPSHSEGFSMSVLEALAARTPVLISTACHFQEVDQLQAGVVVEPTTASLAAGLDRLVELRPTERASMAERGRALVEAGYTWERQGARLHRLYQWILGGGAAPDFVTFS